MTQTLVVDVRLDPELGGEVARELRRQPLLPRWSIRLLLPRKGHHRRARADVVITSAEALEVPTRTPVVVLADDADLDGIWELVGVPGVHGVVLAADSVEDIAWGIAAARSSGVWLSEAIWAQLSFGNGAFATGDHPALTPVELGTLRLLARGMTNSEIASARHVELSTVKFHLANLRLKTGAANRHELMVLAFRGAGGGRSRH